MINSTGESVFIHMIPKETIGGSRGGGRQGRAPPLPGGPNSFIFMQFSANIWKIIALLGVGAPPWGKSWIRHWKHKQ